MKKIILSLSILAIAVTTIIIACDKKNNVLRSSSNNGTPTSSKPFNRQVLPNAVIGYLDSSNFYHTINTSQLEQFFKYTNFLGTNGVLNQYDVISIFDSTQNITKYYISANAVEGTYNISIRFPLEDNGNDNFYLSGGVDGCSCKSTGCVTWGCNVKDYGPCDCSPCGSEDAQCEKTSSRFSLLEIASAF